MSINIILCCGILSCILFLWFLIDMVNADIRNKRTKYIIEQLQQKE